MKINYASIWQRERFYRTIEVMLSSLALIHLLNLTTEVPLLFVGTLSSVCEATSLGSATCVQVLIKVLIFASYDSDACFFFELTRILKSKQAFPNEANEPLLSVVVSSLVSDENQCVFSFPSLSIVPFTFALQPMSFTVKLREFYLPRM